jgi:hypothetical protein
VDSWGPITQNACLLPPLTPLLLIWLTGQQNSLGGSTRRAMIIGDDVLLRKVWLEILRVNATINLLWPRFNSNGNRGDGRRSGRNNIRVEGGHGREEGDGRLNNYFEPRLLKAIGNRHRKQGLWAANSLSNENTMLRQHKWTTINCRRQKLDLQIFLQIAHLVVGFANIFADQHL